MRGPGSKSTALPEPSGPHDDSFSYSLTAKGKRALAALRNEAERQARRQVWEQRAKAAGHRCGTVSGRWRTTQYVPQVRLSGAWLHRAGFELGQEFEVGVEAGALVVRAV